MAENEQPEQLEEEQVADPFGKELADALRANEALLNGLKFEYGQQMLHAQEGGGDWPSPFDLGAIKKLEGQVQNDRMFLEARELTRSEDT